MKGMGLQKAGLMKKTWILAAAVLAALFFFQSAGMEKALTAAGEQTQAEHPKIALTFDDGPHPVYTEQLLDGLKERGVCATFFLIGKNIEGREAVVKRMEEEGHLIGNHTYNHVRLTQVSEREAEEEVQKTCEKICQVTGRYTAFVRPPFGEWRENLEFEVTMIPVSWNVDSKDWITKNSRKIVKKVVKEAGEGDIILMHDIYKSSVAAALEIVDFFQAQGYEFVTADELLFE